MKDPEKQSPEKEKRSAAASGPPIQSPKVEIKKSVIDDEPPATCIGRLRLNVERIITKNYFDYAMGVVIIFNMVMIIVETDHAAKSDDPIPWVEMMGTAILIIFVIELGLRLFVHGWGFFFDGWNNFDFFIVVTDSLFSLLGAILGSVFPVSTLRVFRLCKLARVSKVFRVFPELRIMMAGLIGSFRAIFWGTVLLAFVLLVWAIIAVQFIHPLNKQLGERHERDQCERCPRAYESVLQSTLTFSQQIVAGDSWGQATIPVIEAFPLSALYFMGVFLTVAVAVMNLILGVVVNVASSEHDRLHAELGEEKEIVKMCAKNNILKICEEMDVDESGELSEEELRGFKDSEEFRSAIADLDLTQEDLTIAFSTMDEDHSGEVSYKEFVHKLYKMKDSDAQFMMEQIKYLITQVRDLIVKTMTDNQQEMIQFEEAETKVLEKLEQQNEMEIDVLHNIEVFEKSQMPDGLSFKQATPPREASDIQEKEQKKMLMGWPGATDAVPAQPDGTGIAEKALESKSAGSLDPQTPAAAGPQLSNQRVDALLQAFSHFQVDFKDSLKHLESSLEVHASSTSKLLSRLVPPDSRGDLVAVGPHSMAMMPASARSTGTPLCCGVSARGPGSKF